ncbi:Uncharacterised protein [Mycobacteroides abscessus]|uniref:Uncharacterized protein n=1 Tax=Mycolicibacterium llatzerense TaxID=280871 RepID=A0A0D1JMB4_9MYCO|nr:MULTISPECIES: hypothetical protein [Mycobacteriaceae]KIU13644.1 hypothetical protein TL10_28810 [Mycolicibacterium llatzerense]MCT7372582.1 hypothetical protein [Mycolicibacterium llatzerense]WGI35827.1 hypothetical protein QDT91_28220 [Mycolicibacterium aubagnense]CPT78041.1 Uncharacterised protein [Mycobacteroides abscessus]CPU63223.1 Uncharacterised protein [Mycobacteroides abscessus]
MIIPFAADYRDAWDIILSWRDERAQMDVIAFVEERHRLPGVVVVWIKLLAAIAIELQLEEGLARQLGRVSVGFDIVPQLIARTKEMLETLEPEFDGTKLGANVILDAMPEKYGFSEHLLDKSGLGGVEQDGE